MPDFDDIPDLKVLPAATTELPLSGYGASPTRRGRSRRVGQAIAIGLVWLAAQFGAFGLREDFAQLCPKYILLLILAPLFAGCVSLAVASYPGRLSLGNRPALVTALAVLMPVTFILAVLLTPTPYPRGNSGDVTLGASCLDCILLWALVPLAAVGIALHGTFVVNAVWRSALLGGGCGLVAAGLFGLHCSLVGKWHIALAHGGAALLSGCIGGACLPRLTRI